MIAADSSVFISYFQQVDNAAVRRLDEAIKQEKVALPPVVLTELLSSPKPQPHEYQLLERFRLLEIKLGYWRRTGLLRQAIRRDGLKANMGDALIAQSCIDYDIPLLTVDADFRHYEKTGGLKLVACE